MRLFRLDPQQVRAILERGDAIEHATVLTRPFAELIEVRRQPLRPHQLAVAVDDDVTVDAGDVGDFLAIEEAVVLVAKAARLAAEGDLLGQARAYRNVERTDEPGLDTPPHVTPCNDATTGHHTVRREKK